VGLVVAMVAAISLGPVIAVSHGVFLILRRDEFMLSDYLPGALTVVISAGNELCPGMGGRATLSLTAVNTRTGCQRQYG
jgi:hypothetical protein